jgi:hypothetical protein
VSSPVMSRAQAFSGTASLTERRFMQLGRTNFYSESGNQTEVFFHVSLFFMSSVILCGITKI